MAPVLQESTAFVDLTEAPKPPIFVRPVIAPLFTQEV